MARAVGGRVGTIDWELGTVPCRRAKLGFMSAFVAAASDALKHVPAVNAVIDGDEIVYRDYNDVSVAVATPKVGVTYM